jgi:hypothetical protein
MRLIEFATDEAQKNILKYLNDYNFYNNWLERFTQEQKRAFGQINLKKMPKATLVNKNDSEQPKHSKSSEQNVNDPKKSKAKKTSAQEIQSPKVQSKTLKSKPQTVLPPSSSVASVSAQNALKTRSQKRVPYDPNSVASIQRQLDPLAFDPIVKKLTN